VRMKKITIDDINFEGKNVLVRVDFNVPLNENREITDDSRIQAALPTIQKILCDGGRAILITHLGRPKGEVVDGLGLAPVAKRLSEHLGKPVPLAPDSIGADVESIVENLNNGECLLLENVRFHPEESENDAGFSQQLSKLGDCYVNDAFGTAHRAHSSTEGITHFINTCTAGYLLQKEVEYLSEVLKKPSHPFIAIVGGAKVSTKIDVIEHLLDKTETLLIGGGMMFTFFKASGLEIGDSLLEEDKVEIAWKIIKKAGDKLVLPVDCIIADSFSADANIRKVKIDKIEPGWRGMDIGPETIRLYYKYIIEAQTIIWNGPMGVFEMEPFEAGTREIAQFIADSTGGGAISIIGGGDSTAAVAQFGLENGITHISTGGGASLEMLKGKELPGVTALTDK
jgi:phosphoglycerate kinase